MVMAGYCPQGQTVPRQNRRQYAGERRHRSCRQLDHAGNNQIGLADAQQTHQRSGGQDIQHIAIGKKVALQLCEYDAHDDPHRDISTK